ncbi:carcinoembryonic antigen-related cell adhesion molecule 1-like [Hemibagrus wyckioides]|uniref:carcinoembryonic antigen-related cell adhesion molecule 1-like n=1 Tax=Hemibagrus wyckioides TaxID=337641 RepID=UPI00266B8383|nr:carcinoembryonic antigen-related cell adhesion molecule 1-like [Hemibagrus wyckioides]
MRHGAAVGQCVFSSNSLFGLMCWFGSSVRMQVCFLLLLIQLHITEGCWLKGNGETEEITAYTGGSVLLPCSCTDLHRKPETFTWEKNTNGNKYVQISPESDQYKERYQLVNDHSSGNLSLLISHLTEEDGGVYICIAKEGESRYIRLTVKGCTLNQQTVDVTGNVGQSVLLPCSCSELQAKPHTFTWSFYKGSYSEIFPKDQTNRYTDRVQLFNDHPPGNVSLLISHLTVEDGGWYRCEISNEISKDIRLKVKEAPGRPSISTPKSKPESSQSDSIENPTANHQIIIISSSVAGVLLLLILGGFIYWKHRGQKRGQTQSSDGQTGQKTQQEKQELNEPLTFTITSEPTYEAVDKQNDSSVLYAVINPQTKLKKAEVKDDVTYTSVVHSNTVRAAHTPVESGDTTVYASIKTN